LYINDDWNEVKQLLRIELRLTLFWATAMAKNINREAQIHTKVDGKKVIISKATIRINIKFEDEGGVNCLSNKVIFEQLSLMGVKRLEKKKRSRNHGLKILCKITISARVESSADEQNLGEEDASKQGRNLADIDADAEFTLVGETVEDQGRYDDQKMFDTSVLDDEEDVLLKEAQDIKKSKPKGDNVMIEQEPEQGATTITTTITIPTPDSTMPKARGVVMQEPSKTLTTTTIPISSKVQDKGKDENSQMYYTFSKMLKNFKREDLEVLQRLVKDRFIMSKPMDDMDSFLLHNLKTMFEHHVKDNSTIYYLLVQKMYPLTNHTLRQMFTNVKLQDDEDCEMAYELLRLVKKQLREGYIAN
nr:hypothetical protein [Tanacetum cinerariifolium]